MTNREVIEFYSNKNEHYSLSDEFVKKHQQYRGGYIDFAKKCGKLVDKRLAEPNQKWHLLESYYRQKLKEGKIHMDADAKCWSVNWQSGGFKCPELLLWMAEAAGINIKEAKKATEILYANNKRAEAHKMIKKLITWEMIEEKIKKSEEY